MATKGEAFPYYCWAIWNEEPQKLIHRKSSFWDENVPPIMACDHHQNDTVLSVQPLQGILSYLTILN